MLSQQLRDARDLVVPPWAVPPYASKQNGGYNASISVQTRGGGTAASVAVPRRSASCCWRQPGCFYSPPRASPLSARIAGTAGGNQAVSTHEDDGPAHSRSPSCLLKVTAYPHHVTESAHTRTESPSFSSSVSQLSQIIRV